MLGATILIMILAHLYKNRLENQRKINISDFNQYEGYRINPPSTNSRESSNYSPIKSKDKK